MTGGNAGQENNPSKSGEDFEPISPLPGDKAKVTPVPDNNPGQANNPSLSNGEPMGGQTDSPEE